MFPCPRSRLKIWSRETGSAVPSRVSWLISILRMDQVFTYEIPPDFRGAVYLFILNRHTPSGQPRVCRVTQLRTDGVHCRESAGTGQINFMVVPNECWSPCVCVCIVIPFILDVRLVDAPAGVTQKEGHTGFLIHLPFAMLALIFIARRVQPSLSLADREVEFCVPSN